MWPFKKKKPKAKPPDPLVAVNEKLDAVIVELKTMFRLDNLRAAGFDAKLREIATAVDEAARDNAEESESIRNEVRLRRTIRCRLMLGTPDSLSRELASIRDEIRALSVSDR